MTNEKSQNQESSLTKLHLYRTVKKCIFSKMDSGVISADRAEEILSYVQKHIVQKSTSSMLLDFCHDLALRYPELQSVEMNIQTRQHEALSMELLSCLDELMDADAMAIIEDVLSYHNSIQEDASKTLEYLQRRYPAEYEHHCKK